MNTLIVDVVHVYFQFGHLEFWTSNDNSANGAMSILDVSNNNIGQLVCPDGWKSKDDDDAAPWLRIADGHEQDEHPGKPEGLIALAEAINSASGALSELNISGNALTQAEAPSDSSGWAGVYSMEGVIALADVLKK